MARPLKTPARFRAPAPPSAQPGTLSAAPLGGTRAEAVRRLQMGLVGMVAVLVLIGLASIIKDRATATASTAVAGAAATSSPGASTAAPDALAEAGVVPDMPSSASSSPAGAPPARAGATPAPGPATGAR